MQQFSITETEKVKFPGLDEFFMDEQHPDPEISEIPRVASLWATSRLGVLQCRLDSLQAYSFGYMKVPMHKVINVANEVFGYEGWSTQIVAIDAIELEMVNEKYVVTATAVVRVVLKDGTSLESLGLGRLLLPERGSTYRTAKMLAVTDAIKQGIMELPLLSI